MSDIRILDACCGSRMFWFDKDNEFTTYMDIREENFEICGKKSMLNQTLFQILGICHSQVIPLI